MSTPSPHYPIIILYETTPKNVAKTFGWTFVATFLRTSLRRQMRAAASNRKTATIQRDREELDAEEFEALYGRTIPYR